MCIAYSLPPVGVSSWQWLGRQGPFAGGDAAGRSGCRFLGCVV